MQNLIKKPAAYPRNKRKKKKTKILKPKPYFPIKIQTHSDQRFFAASSNTQIRLACSNLSNRRKIKPLQQLKPLQRWKSLFVPYNRRFRSYPASVLQQQTIQKVDIFLSFFVFYSFAVSRVSKGKKRVQPKVYSSRRWAFFFFFHSISISSRQID